MINDIHVIGIMGSGKELWADYTVPLAVWIAKSGYHILTGGGKGVMLAASEAFTSTTPRRGISIGVIPTDLTQEGIYHPKDGYPNKYIELSIISPLGTYTGETKAQLSRNHINIMTSNIIVALPGHRGTLNEVMLAYIYSKPTILFGPEEEFKNFPVKIPRTNKLKHVCDFIGKNITELSG